MTKVLKPYHIEIKEDTLIPMLKVVLDISLEMSNVLEVIRKDPSIDVKPMLAEWINKLRPEIIHNCLNEARYASRKRLQTARKEKESQIEGSKTQEETKEEKKEVR